VNSEIDRVERAEELPEQWDALTADYYQTREFLIHCQAYNPCRQRYYLSSESGSLRAGAVVYTIRLDLFTYRGISSPVTTQIIGIPASVSSAGITGDPAFRGEFLTRILAYEPGLVACLNLDGIPPGSPMFPGRTWPNIVLANRFSSWEEYISALRSDYRRRLMRVLAESSGFDIQRSSCRGFTNEMHCLYLNVFSRSEGKLERLDASFFQNLPASFCLTTYGARGTVRGWTITARDKDRNRFYFFLGGQEYTSDPKTLYLVKLLDIIRMGIGLGSSTIDLGQSAEIPKMRLGGQPREKYMLAYHHRPLQKSLLRAGMGALSYRKHFPETHVFRGNGS
jgi:hypothetical protein